MPYGVAFPTVTRGGDRDDDRILVYVHADKSCRLLHDPSPVPEAPRRTIRRDPRSCTWRDGSPLQGGHGSSGEGSSGRCRKHRQAGSKGSALGGSRAEPWPYFPSRVPRTGNGHEVYRIKSQRCGKHTVMQGQVLRDGALLPPGENLAQVVCLAQLAVPGRARTARCNRP